MKEIILESEKVVSVEEQLETAKEEISRLDKIVKTLREDLRLLEKVTGKMVVEGVDTLSGEMSCKAHSDDIIIRRVVVPFKEGLELINLTGCTCWNGKINGVFL